MVEILYVFESLGTAVFVAAALLCLAVGALAFKLDKPAVVVVSLVLGMGIGHFLSMAAWGEGIGTVYLGSCVGLLSLLVSIKVRPVKRFFLAGVSVFLACTAVVLVIANSVGGSTATYQFESLSSGTYETTTINMQKKEIVNMMADVMHIDSKEVKAEISEDRTSITFKIPAANYTQLKAYGAEIVARTDGFSRAQVTDYSSWWTISIIIGAIFGIAAGVLAQFKKFEKFMQILGTGIFGGIFGAIFCYLGLGELCGLVLGPILAVGAVFLQLAINRNKESDAPEAPTGPAMPTV